MVRPPARRRPPAGGLLPAPSQPEPGMLGSARPRWAVHLERCRAGATGRLAATREAARALYTYEAKHGTYPLRRVAPPGDGRLATDEAPLPLAGETFRADQTPVRGSGC